MKPKLNARFFQTVPDTTSSRVKPFATQEEKMAYAKASINCRPGFSPAPDHAILVCENYKEPSRKVVNQFRTKEYMDNMAKMFAEDLSWERRHFGTE